MGTACAAQMAMQAESQSVLIFKKKQDLKKKKNQEQFVAPNWASWEEGRPQKTVDLS